MSLNIPTHYAEQFSTNIQLLLQQKGSRLRNAVMTGSHVGSQASPVDQIGKIEMLPVTSRFGAMPRVDATMDRRWCFPADYHLPQLIDSFDKLRLLTDPESSYVQNAVHAAGRQMDRLINTAFFGTAYTGVNGGTSTAFDTSGQVVAYNYGATGAVGLTVAKIRAAKKILMANEVDIETDPIYMALTARQHDDLLGEAQVVSTDFNDRPVLVEGKIMRFLGVNFIHTELLTFSTYRLNPMWAKSGMYLGVWSDINTSISKRNDLESEPWQAYVKVTAGATRTDEDKVVRIQCDET